MNTSKTHILLSNDDGIDSPGLWAAAEALSELGYVTVAAPRDHMSATGRGYQKNSDGMITKKQLTVHGQTWDVYAVGGSPSQSVVHGILEIVPYKPDLVVAGINFGENLREDILDTGFAHGSEADVMLCVGSSMRVNPAAEMASLTAERGRNLVIINLMKTPLDAGATLVINGKCQVVFELLMKKLGMAIPEWNIKRQAKIALSTRGDKEYLSIKGVCSNNNPYDFFKGV